MAQKRVDNSEIDFTKTGEAVILSHNDIENLL